MEVKLTRDLVRLISTGQYVYSKNGFDQQEHSQYVDGALYSFDLMQTVSRDRKRGENESELKKSENRTIEKQI